MTGLKSPLGWFGGKSRLAKYLIPIIDSHHHTIYVEPFAGGASVFFAKARSPTEVLNDVNTNLMQFYQKVQTDAHPCQNYGTKTQYIESQNKLKSGTWDLCDFLIVNKNSFAKKMLTFGLGEKCSSQSKKNGTCNVLITNQHMPQIQDRLQQVKFHNTDYTEMIQQYDSPNTFFYADPPYDVNQSQSYRTDLSSVTPEKIATNFQHIKGKVLISFNDSSEIRKEFTSRGYYVFPIEVKYTSNPFNQHKRPELLITNFPLKL